MNPSLKSNDQLEKKKSYTFDKWVTFLSYKAHVNQREKGSTPKEKWSTENGA